jgi:alpha-1,3-mannosyl-glycoprotein beta-1,2-N-acetylglucosaminyltransferase
MSQFYIKYLAPIQFAPVPAVWHGRNLSFLLKEAYDAAFEAQLAAARPLSLTEARALGGWGGDGGGSGAVRVSYSSAAELKRMSHEMGIMEDLKAGVPRTAYRGVVQLRIGGTPVLLAPAFRMDQDITKPLPGRP